MHNNELYHHGIKGQRWGVRRYQNKDGTLTEEGQKHWNNLYRPDRKVTSKTNILTGEIGVIKKGTEILRITSSDNETIDNKRKYAVLKDEKNDLGNYQDTEADRDHPTYIDSYRVTKDLKVATAEKVISDLLEEHGNDRVSKYVSPPLFAKKETDKIVKDLSKVRMKDLYKDLDEYTNTSSQKNLNLYTKHMMNLDGYKSNDAEALMLARALAGQRALKEFASRHFDMKEKVFDRYRSQGYDAVADIMDISQGFAKQPIVFLNPKDQLERTEHKKMKKYDSYKHSKGSYFKD